MHYIIIIIINFELSMLSGTLAKMVAKCNQLTASVDLARVEVAKRSTSSADITKGCL